MIAVGEYLLLEPLTTGSRSGSAFIHLDEGLRQYAVLSVGSACKTVPKSLKEGDIVVLADEQLIIQVDGDDGKIVATIEANVVGVV